MTDISKFKEKEQDQLKHIGNNLRDLRNKKGYSQETVAKELKCHQDRVSRIENGTARLSITDLIALSKLFNVTPNEILGFPPDRLKPDEFELFVKIKKLRPKQRDSLNSVIEQLLNNQ